MENRRNQDSWPARDLKKDDDCSCETAVTGSLSLVLWDCTTAFCSNSISVFVLETAVEGSGSSWIWQTTTAAVKLQVSYEEQQPVVTGTAALAARLGSDLFVASETDVLLPFVAQTQKHTPVDWHKIGLPHKKTAGLGNQQSVKYNMKCMHRWMRTGWFLQVAEGISRLQSRVGRGSHD